MTPFATVDIDTVGYAVFSAQRPHTFVVFKYRTLLEGYDIGG